MTYNAKVILLKGNKSNPEPAEHIIKFPGGSISVSRTSDNEYWAHVLINDREVNDDFGVMQSAAGKIVDTRLDYNNPPGDIREIEDLEKLNHIAVRIQTS